MKSFVMPYTKLNLIFGDRVDNVKQRYISSDFLVESNDIKFREKIEIVHINLNVGRKLYRLAKVP